MTKINLKKITEYPQASGPGRKSDYDDLRLPAEPDPVSRRSGNNFTNLLYGSKKLVCFNTKIFTV